LKMPFTVAATGTMARMPARSRSICLMFRPSRALASAFGAPGSP